jgi:hemoglobin
MKAVQSIVVMMLLVAGCGSEEKKDRDFFTSGSRDADQRAEQRIAKVEQIRGTAGGTDKPGDAKKPLFERLGGDKGVAAIVDDFVKRMLADPRVNFERKGITRGGWSVSRGKSVEWQATDANVGQLKKHIVQFIALSTGGPAFYDGKEMKGSHAELHITNAEFDAAVGDLKAAMDNLALGTEEQKELLSIIESTRTQIVTEK